MTLSRSGDGPGSGAAPPQPSGANRRQHLRVDTRASARFTIDDHAYDARVENVSLGGALVVLLARRGVPMGTGVRLEFVLPDGFQVSVLGTVVRTQPSADGETAYGLQFGPLDSLQREVLGSYVRRLAEAGAASDMSARIHEKHRVDVVQARCVVTIVGFLTPAEGLTLERALQERLLAASGTRLDVYLDASRYVASSEAVVESLRRMFAELARHGVRSIVICEPAAFGAAQLRRVASASSLADRLTTCTSAADGLATFERLAASPAT